MTTQYIEGLVAAYPTVREVWLIGSRANDDAHVTSDWDYLVLANQSTMEALRKDKKLHDPHIDLLVVYDGNRFEKPWGAKRKAGSLKDWKWRKISDKQAEYRSTKSAQDGVGVITKTLQAKKIWPP